MAAAAHITLAPWALASNDNARRPDMWPDVIKLFTSFGQNYGIAAWRARRAGQSALGFVEEVLAQYELLSTPVN